jgi:hypothetical protein
LFLNISFLYFSEGLFYTAVTRSRTAGGLFLPGFQPKCLRANKDGQTEIERIRQHSMVEFDHPRLHFFHNFPTSDWNYVSLQNIRSMHLHKDDVLADPIIMVSSVICLTETSLTTNIWPAANNFEAYDIFQKNRNDAYDRIELQQRLSGGVGLLSEKEFCTTQRPTDITSDLEIISCRTNFAVISGKKTYVSLIYKDHRMRKQEFLRKMEHVFKAHRNNVGLVLGDFNINMLEDDSLYEVASSEGFRPLVTSGTTIHEHLLDQMFINSNISEKEIQVQVLPSYFSDHHLVVLCIKKQ